MDDSKDRSTNIDSLVVFLANYSQLVELQIGAVKQTLTDSLSGVMKKVTELSAQTGAERRNAESALEETYITPDADTTHLVQKMQSTVDDIISGARGEIKAKPTDTDSMETALNGLASKFQDKIQRMEEIDKSLQDILYEMVGSLSADDVVSQRLTHVSNCLCALQLGIANLMVDFPHRCSGDDVKRFEENLLRFTRSVYTMSDERKLLDKVFKAS